MTAPVAGWYPDPSGRPGERWWNGVSWSEQTRATPPPAPVPAVPAGPTADAPHGWDGFGQPATAPGPPPPSYGGFPPQANQGNQGMQGPPGGFGVAAPRPPDTRSFAARNGFSLGALGVTVAYLLILFFAHFAILGILPAVLAFRAIGRREPLAIPAAVVAVIVFVLGIYEFTR